MNEVLAAAKRLRANEYDCLEDANIWQRDNDLETIASAALAEGMFREDDGEAVTEKSLKADAWAYLDGTEWAYYIGDFSEIKLFCEVGSYFKNGFLARIETGEGIVYLPHINTRGQLRSLLAALGIVKGAE